MTATPTAELITAEEFLHMPENEGAELVAGAVKKRGGGSFAAYISGNLQFRIGLHARITGAGRVFGAGCGSDGRWKREESLGNVCEGGPE